VVGILEPDNPAFKSEGAVDHERDIPEDVSDHVYFTAM